MDSRIDHKSAETIPVALVEQSVWRALQEPFARFGGRVAIADQTGNLTFRELRTWVERIANIILASGPSEKRAIGILLTQGAPFVAALLATLKAGHYYVPLNPANPVEANRQILRDAEACLLLTDSNYARIAKSTGEAICHVQDIDRLDETASDTADSPRVCAGDLAGLFYTSGTTGKPKGVMQTQRNFLHGTHSFIKSMEIGSDDRLLLGYNGSTCASVKNIFAGLLTGATLCPWDIAQDGATAMADWLNNQRITVFYIFRSAFSQCMSAVAPDVRFPQVRALMLSSEPVYDKDVTIWHERFPAANVFINHLGSTEVGTYRRYAIDRAATVAPGILPLGYCVEDKDVLLCDEHGEPVGPGEIGEIVVKSRYIALGYWKQPALSESVFSAPYGPDGERLFRTGDLGRMDADGCLHSFGRKDDQVKIRGRRVELANVEATLAALEHIDQAAVVARNGEDDRTQLVAFFVSTEDRVTANRLRRQLAEILPTVEVPAFFERLQALPRLPNGKIDRKALAAREIVPQAAPYAGPRDTVEKRLTAVLQRVLQAEQLGIDDNVFEHGADSLTAVEIAAAIEQEFGVDVPMEVMWSGAHSLAALAQLIRQADDYPQPSHELLATPAPNTAPINARPSGYVNPRRLIAPSDLAKLALLPAAILTAKLVPETQWRRTADLFGLLLTVLRSRQYRALGQEIARQCDGFAGPADGRTVLRGIRSGSFELWLRKLTSPTSWKAPLALIGQQHIERGLSRGRGVVLWLSPVKFTGVVGHQAVHQAGYPVNMLSRPEHGLSPTVFGQRFLNRFAYRGLGPAHVKRIVMIDDGQAAIETLRGLLRDNRIVAIVAAAATDQPLRYRFLGGEIELASGPPRLALATGAALLPVYAHRHAEGYQVLVNPPLEPDDTAKDTAIESLLSQFINQLERFVRQYPAESNHWVALQKRTIWHPIFDAVSL
jgi:amino acid adenylation domain-containing protein